MNIISLLSGFNSYFFLSGPFHFLHQVFFFKVFVNLSLPFSAAFIKIAFESIIN